MTTLNPTDICANCGHPESKHIENICREVTRCDGKHITICNCQCFVPKQSTEQRKESMCEEQGLRKLEANVARDLDACICKKCGETYELGDGLVPSELCNDCCQSEYTQLQQQLAEAKAEVAQYKGFKVVIEEMMEVLKSPELPNEGALEMARRVAAYAHHQEFLDKMGIKTTDAKWLDPECHNGCQSLIYKQERDEAKAEVERLKGVAENHRNNSATKSEQLTA